MARFATCVAYALLLLLPFNVDLLAADGDARRLVTAPIAVSQITREASAGWKRDRTLPRDRCDFATDKGWRVQDASLITVLGRKLNKDAAFEAYVKWQLLSFEPDLSQLSSQQLERLLSGMTPMHSYPKTVSLVSDPGGQSGNLVNRVGASVGGQRVGLDRRSDQQKRRPATKADIVAATNAKLAAQHAEAQASNVIIARYRAALIDRLPATGPTRLKAMIEDVRTRVEAGDPSQADAAQRLLDASEAAKSDTTLTTAQREELSQLVAKAASRKWPVVRKVKQTDGGQITYDADYVSFDVDLSVRIRKNLLTQTKK